MTIKHIENNIHLNYICNVYNYYKMKLHPKDLYISNPSDFFNSKIFDEYEKAYNIHYRKEKLKKLTYENSTNN